VKALRAVLFDVDFTLAKPGPDLGPEGYRRLGERFGFDLDLERYPEARAAAIASLERHPALKHDEETWIVFTERIIQGMGGRGKATRDCALEMTIAWERADNFELFDDALPVLAELRRRGLLVGLVSNTGRDLPAFVEHHRLDVDAALSSREHGTTKPHPTIFRAVLDRLGVASEEAAMVGDSPEDDVEGARALGMLAFLLDREDRYPDWEGPRLPTLLALPAALGLGPTGR
jgi:putative hydrolase of the HAD superfamily